MFDSLKNAWRIPEIRKKLVYTLFMLLLYRLLSVIPVPGINLAEVQKSIASLGLLDFMNMMTGGSFAQMSIMAMGITPYINASIILQLLTVAIPALERLSKEGAEGRKKINTYTRYLTVVLAFVQAVGLVYAMGAVRSNSWYAPIVIGLSMAAGSALAMWMGERITENGIGNGISLLIFAGIVGNLSSWVQQMVGAAISTGNASTWIAFVVVLVSALLMIVLITFVDMGERRIPIQYAKRVSGRKMYGGQSTHIPMKVNSTGVLPLIFAYAILQFPGTIMAFWPQSAANIWWLSVQNSWIYQGILALLIIGFTYFYTSITFNPREISDNIGKNGGTIPGIRMGRPTTEYLGRVSNRLTLFGALFLAILATVPTFITRLMSTSTPFAASSLLIAVSVALETMRQLEGQLIMRHHKGFL